MSLMHELLDEVVTRLEASGFCANVQILETAIFSSKQFTFKIRATIFSSYTLQARIYFNQEHCDYSYQVFDELPLCRWDNKEHFPSLTSFPHHYHTIDGKITASPLKGDPVSDLELVLAELKRLFSKQN